MASSDILVVETKYSSYKARIYKYRIFQSDEANPWLMVKLALY